MGGRAMVIGVPAESVPGERRVALVPAVVPRITRAQSMDALSAMATVVGYKAVLLAADTPTTSTGR